MARISEAQPHPHRNTPGVGNGVGDIQLALDNREQVRKAPDEFPHGWLRELGAKQGREWVAAGDGKRSTILKVRWKKAQSSIERANRSLQECFPENEAATEQRRWILDNWRLLRGASNEVGEALKSLQELPRLRPSPEETGTVPRAYQVANDFLSAVGFKFEEDAFGEYLIGVQQVATLEMRELWALKPLLQYVLLEQLGAAAEFSMGVSERGNCSPDIPLDLPSKAVASLREIVQMEWKQLFKAHSVVDQILRSDPSGVYARMDFESRELYLKAVADLVRYTKLSEAGVAKRAILCARKATDRKRGVNERATERRSNVGYYLLDSGIARLRKAIGYRPSIKRKLKDLVLDWPEVFYVAGIEFTTLVMVFLFLRHVGEIIPLVPGLLLLIPASQASVGFVNHLITWFLPPRRLPRLDFSEGIPDGSSTLVAVPSLLLSEQEVRHIVESLEVRYLGNRDPNLHFALLTDSPDSCKAFDEHDELVALCSSLIEQLNAKYARDRQGSFFHLHRHRVYNPQEKTWMGWERKRGKLLDLNKLLLGGADNFPVKVGDRSILPMIRYVMTLDSDTRLPRDTAYKLIGTMAHPLNRAVIDRKTNTVVAGYGILQPRIGVSIESARKSRLASIYSGETGFDLYTRAVSNVYQDLFGEGSFTGKGIYEVETFQRVLGNRFPTNALLSHDLIEGIYARTGLVSDIDVIDDYPSHFSAYCRRMHRWVRGDWQILRWLFPSVPDFFGRQVPNPITLLSRWKVFDNLRRSLVELNLFLLLLAGWFVFPGGALYWTAIVLALLLIPTYIQTFFSFLQVSRADHFSRFLKERANAFITGHLQVFVMLVFLPHKAFVMLDAILRALARLAITHRNLLEWETAAEAEAGTRKKTAVETYLALTPWFALAVGLSLAFLRPSALLVAAPILSLWLMAGAFTKWINQPPRRRKNDLNPRDVMFLRLAALATWRYFREFSNAGVNWFIPDRVQETPPIVVHTMSPTNLGILLNARLAAYHLGYLSLTEFIVQTEETMIFAKRLPRFNGHFLNWYDVRSFKPLSPNFISTVDSGNLAACLWTLKQACLGLLKEPLITRESWQGIRDHISFALELINNKVPPPEVVSLIQELARSANSVGDDPADWIDALAGLQNEASKAMAALHTRKAEDGRNCLYPVDEVTWWLSETVTRIESVRRNVHMLAPWLWPEYGQFHLANPQQQITLNSLPSIIPDLEEKLSVLQLAAEDDGVAETLQSLSAHLKTSFQRAAELAGRLRHLAEEADELLQEMDFAFLYDPKRKLLRVGYDVEARQFSNSHYDLLGSEARTATYVAIAKGDIRQESWFHLGRSRTLEQGEAALVSWSGTMFEYLMPLLWMRSYSGTMLDQSMSSAVVCQQRYAKKRNVPWGISEAAFSLRDHDGIYQYHAFGLPGLAVDPNASKEIVIAPYASFLALLIDSTSATRNLVTMREKGWFGRFGFYESAGYSNGQMRGMTDHELTRCWMAHHQGMSLLAVCNLLTRCSMQRWFHQEPRVAATELLLHEKIPLAGPEKGGLAVPPRRSLRSPGWETAVHSALPEPTSGSGQVLEVTRIAGKASLEPRLDQPASNGEVSPPPA